MLQIHDFKAALFSGLIWKFFILLLLREMVFTLSIQSKRMYVVALIASLPPMMRKYNACFCCESCKASSITKHVLVMINFILMIYFLTWLRHFSCLSFQYSWIHSNIIIMEERNITELLLLALFAVNEVLSLYQLASINLHWNEAFFLMTFD